VSRVRAKRRIESDALRLFPLRIAKRPASGYGVTFTVPNALHKRIKLTLVV